MRVELLAGRWATVGTTNASGRWDKGYAAAPTTVVGGTHPSGGLTFPYACFWGYGSSFAPSPHKREANAHMPAGGYWPYTP